MKTVLFIMLIFLAVPVLGDWGREQVRIDFLLDQISRVDGAFIRNGTTHQPDEAVAHLRMKLDRAVNSWFAPDRDEWTAEMFIEKLASRSSISGKPYQIQFRDGRTVNAGPWLLEKLKAARQ